MTHVGLRSRKEWVYRPHIRFDAHAFDLVHVNPANRPLDLVLRFMSAAGHEVQRANVRVPVRGTIFTSHSNPEGALVHVESVTRSSLWRPIIFKYYETHFDVLHG